ncbi:riboflavin synthase [Wenzhouxiangella marina]|uniref:Riboflavin synthase n=1 Tax=Wenzhouxiangella marina TaxID=1579979 RepID=A0A0K0XY54_9GAMM|nr:riboflavin synthase [Wenzhouxiangella marina]AKS42600.1 Riboflavin synthase subunit alpha [Wenzhouxiangella marina]MBB6085618.1 riboflavin synthase [Wenzhouxiangella marina]
MFTGIIQAVGTVTSFSARGDGARLAIRCPELEPARWSEGDSVAVAGCCLTALELTTEGFEADLSGETLRCTSLGRLAEGAPVNLEPALAMGDRLGGHWVTGHVDGLARLAAITPLGDNRRLEFQVPAELARFVAAKGSVTLDGVSLTVNRVRGDRFEVNLIPHTLEVTTLGRLRENDEVNLEVDLLARYMDRLLEQRQT